MRDIKEENYKWIWGVIFLIFAVLSFTLFHDLYLNWDFIKYAVSYLDGKANVVLGITGAATSASVAITMIPGDVGTPIASQLANISSYSILILAAVHLEKYLITLAAEIGFKGLLPISLITASFNTMFLQNTTVTKLVKKVSVFLVALILVIPSSVYLSTMIEKTYKEDVQQSIEETEREAEEIKRNLEAQDQSVIDQFFSSISGGTLTLVNKFENSLNNFIEAIAVMLITSCAIPLLTFLLLIWLIRNVLQIDIQIPSMPNIIHISGNEPFKLTLKENKGDRNE